LLLICFALSQVAEKKTKGKNQKEKKSATDKKEANEDDDDVEQSNSSPSETSDGLHVSILACFPLLLYASHGVL
jgi:hypothetical protein